MSTMFGGGGQKATRPTSAQNAAALGLRVNTSVYGLVIPLVYGRTRISPNLIWYGDFKAIAHTTTTSSGGGGGGGGKGGGSGGSSSSTSTSYTYRCAVVFGLCAGVAQAVGRVWRAKAATTLAEQGLTLFAGAIPQTPWGYLETNHPGEALGYPNIAYVAASAFDLGDSDSLPNMAFEITGRKSGNVPGQVDCDPADVIRDLLEDPFSGAGFPAARIGDLDVYSGYCRAAGLLVSPAFTTQSEAREILAGILGFTNSEPVWSEGKLKVVPRGDEAISGNGGAYTPPAQPAYDLTDDAFLCEDGEDPVVLVRKRPADANNLVRLEYLDRDANYDPAVAEAKDSAAIERYGERCDSTREAHLFADGDAAQASADLLLKKGGILNAYRFRLGMEYSRLEPMDIVTLTDAAMGLDRQWVRIVEIEEDEEGALAITAEEYLAGSGAAARYTRQATSGYVPDYRVDPGDVARLALFEPPLELAGGYELWAAAVGASGVWGGCEYWVSSDGDTYRRVGSQAGPARAGYVLEDGGAYLDVDISGYPGALLSGSAADAANLATLCHVGGEYLAYQDAELIGAGQYRLTGLVRGAYDSVQATHAAGEMFVRLDSAVFRYPLDAAYVGKPLYIKACSFNIYRAATQSIADVAPRIYYPTGRPLLEPPADVENFRIAINGAMATLTWDPVPGRGRTLHYEIRFTPATENGAWGSAAGLADNVATCSAQVPAMNGTFLIKAVIAAGVESESAASIVVTSVTVLNMNVVAAMDEAGAGFPGDRDGAVVVNGALRLASQDTLSDWPSLAAVSSLAWGRNGVVSEGTYGFAQTLDLGGAFVCRVAMGLDASALAMGNTLSAWPSLSAVRWLSGADPGKWRAVVQVRTTSDDPGASPQWSSWADLVVGDYTARAFQFRVVLSTGDASVTPAVGSLAVSVDMPDRVDGASDVTVPAAGLAVTFSPAFRATPAIGYGAQDLQTGDVVLVSGQTPAGFFIQVKNAGGSGVQRTLDWIARGYGYAQ